ncbi:hypothetical protein SFMTTN_2070 [Sulfuriferula multivorans]|uniref:Uncharacterized protein n=1 Tax=Sulfuriferula multivorans TaxID=1559896 RepID=A0A401JF44_9PROT|nr:hypothetical protein [Sulfuriferula multivorans]GBL46257.1 hypothetical protein SFMTTN_2070 [Sulfuriferula multivorans]
MNTNQLAAALRNKAEEVREVGDETQHDQLMRDSSYLLRVLANVVDGMPLAKAFGSPGDWGYDTQIGQALAMPAVPKTTIDTSPMVV